MWCAPARACNSATSMSEGRALQLRVRLAILLFPSLVLVSSGLATLARAADITQTVRLSPAAVKVERGPAGDRVLVGDSKFVTATDPGLPELPYRIVNVLLPEGE